MTFWELGGAFFRRLDCVVGRFDLVGAGVVESVADSAGNGKVVSATHWGNLLIWDSGRGKIELEVTRRDGSNCHDGSINQLVAGEGELITIGTWWVRNLSHRLSNEMYPATN